MSRTIQRQLQKSWVEQLGKTRETPRARRPTRQKKTIGDEHQASNHVPIYKNRGIYHRHGYGEGEGCAKGLREAPWSCEKSESLSIHGCREQLWEN